MFDNTQDSVFSHQSKVRNPDSNLPIIESFKIDNPLSSTSVSDMEGCDILLSVDGVGNNILKLTANSMASIRAKYIKPLQDKTFPSSWKEALTTSVYKKVNAHDCSNHRHVALASCFSKICEK